MSDVAIRVENLGKEYRIGTAQASYRTIRDNQYLQPAQRRHALYSGVAKPKMWYSPETEPRSANGERLSRGAKNTVMASSAYDSRIGTPKACNSPAQGGARSRMRPRRHPGFSASMNPGTPTACDKCTPCRTLAGCVYFGLPTQGAPLTRRPWAGLCHRVAMERVRLAAFPLLLVAVEQN